MRILNPLLISIAILFSLLLGLGGCTWQHQHDVAAQQTRACVATCQEQMKECKSRCGHNCHTCEQAAVQDTKRNYQRYIKERCLQGKSFIRRLQSYHDPLQCRKPTCDCAADLRVCVESCRGEIHKQIQVEKSCC